MKIKGIFFCKYVRIIINKDKVVRKLLGYVYNYNRLFNCYLRQYKLFKFFLFVIKLWCVVIFEVIFVLGNILIDDRVGY